MLFFCSNVNAWENIYSHIDISEAAAKLSFTNEQMKLQYALNGQKKSLLDWLKTGAKLEDSGSISSLATARYRNHFHNPLASLTPPMGTLTKGGLSDMGTGQSTLFWAQDGHNQSQFLEGDWSWQTIRTNYYRSLTTTSRVGIEMFTAMTYLGLGYQMHLIQDMAQPDHVRNDSHPIDASDRLWGFETWAKNKKTLILQYAATAAKPAVDLTQPLYDGYAPVGRLIDTRRYAADRTPSASMNQGLAEYTNSNFFSDDTIFAARYAEDDKHYFPFPRKEGTDIQKCFDGTKAPEAVYSEDGKLVNGLWVSKVGEGETVPHLLRVGPMADAAYALLGEGKLSYDRLGRDEVTYTDYAQLLLPRAVGYSAALLDYFFRGAIKLTVKPSDIKFRSVKVTAQNSTAGETMESGEAVLVIRYKALPETPLGGARYLLDYAPEESTLDRYSHKVSKPQAVDLTNPKELTFDFSDDPLPYLFDDITMQLVFKGKLGNEEGAVAVSSLAPIEGIYSEITVSLPASAVYAKTTDGTLGAAFNELRVTVQTDIPGGLSGGSFELALEYDEATSDPFQSLPVETNPLNAAGYLLRFAEVGGVSSLSPGVPVELIFDLSQYPLSVRATDVYLNILYKIPGTSKTVTVGYLDISEPTPVDIFNNADKICIHGQWYNAGSSEARAVAEGSLPTLFDFYAHNIADIFFKATSLSRVTPASPTDYTIQSPDLLAGGSYRRLGYILTDYSFRYSAYEDWLEIDSADGWYSSDEPNAIYTGTAVKNQCDTDGNCFYPLMYSIRGNKMWWGAGIEYNNWSYPSNSSCATEAMP